MGLTINAAKWKGLEKSVDAMDEKRLTEISKSSDSFRVWRQETRKQLRDMLGIPEKRVPLNAEKRGEIEHDGIVIEKWVFTVEPGSRLPALLYRPKISNAPMPAIVFTYGHGGSKSSWPYHYSGQLYARLGLAALAIDPLGEEERHIASGMGTRAHDPKQVHDRADQAGRLIMGKLVFDTMCGIDFLMERNDIDRRRIGVAGNSLGGAVSSWMAALEPRIKLAIVSGWTYQDIGLRTKYCTKAPNQRMRELISWPEYAALAAPDCAVLIMNGDADWVIDREDDKIGWAGMETAVEAAAKTYASIGAAGKIQTFYEPGGGHRPYFSYREALEWIHKYLGTPAKSLEEIRALPTINSRDWCSKHGIEIEKFYSSTLHQGGASLLDMNIRPLTREELACLKPSELGSLDFTVEGWLRSIERN